MASTPASPSRSEVSCNEVRSYCEDNHFDIPTGVAAPDPAGSLREQTWQAAKLYEMGALAITSKAQQQLGTSPDALAARSLNSLDRNPPLANEPAERSLYTSNIPGADPRTAYEYFVNHPNELFQAAGIQVFPSTSAFTQGGRVMLEEPGVTPPVWAPIEVELDEKNNRVRIHTLDGHPLRGTNEFTFSDDGQGGTNVTEKSDFQESSFVANHAGAAMSKLGKDPIERQHEIWNNVHAHLADHVERTK
ncbi:MAG: SRPBCC family protein [Myxococcaceae bacterium]